MKLRSGAAIALMVGLPFIGCELVNDAMDPDPDSIETIVYSTHIQPIFDTHCTGCHSGEAADAGLRLDNWANTTLGSDRGEALIPYSSAHSTIIRLLTNLPGDPHPIDKGKDGLSVAQIAILDRWISEGATDDEGTIPFVDSRDLLYVCNQGEASISVIDILTKHVIRRIDLVALGFTANAAPYDVVVEPDGSHWYVSLAGDNAVLKFTHKNELVAQASVIFPGMLALHPTVDMLYVGRALNSAKAPPSIVSIRKSDMFAEEIPVVFPRPHAVVVHPQGGAVFSVSFEVDQLMTIEPETGDVTFVPVAGPLHSIGHFAMSQDGKSMWGSGWANSYLTLFDITDPLDVRQRVSLPVASDPRQVEILPDESAIYVASNQEDVIVVIPLESTHLPKEISGLGISEPFGMSVTGDSRYVFVSNANNSGAYIPRFNFGDNFRMGTVVVIDTESDEIVKVIEVGKRASGLGMRAGTSGS